MRALHREFPKGASEWLDPVSRRGFLKLMGASLALAGMTSCVKQPLEPIVPYVRQPEEIVLGKPLFFATAMTMGGYRLPLLVQSNMRAAHPRWRAIRSTRLCWVAATSSRRPRFSTCTTPTARSHEHVSRRGPALAVGGRGHPAARRRCSRPAAARAFGS